MSLPPHPIMVPLTGRYIRKDGNPASGVVILRSLQPLMTAGAVLLPREYHFVLDVTGSFSGAVAATNDPEVHPLNWPYAVEERIDGIGRKPFLTFVDYQLTSVDMSDLSPAVPPGQLISTRGLPGRPGKDGVTTVVGGVSQAFADARYIAQVKIGVPTGVPGLDDQGFIEEDALPLPDVDFTILFENKLL